MTNGPSNDRLDRIEAILLNLAERQDRMEQQQQRTQDQIDREIAVVAELRAAQVSTNQQLTELGEMVANLTIRQEESIQQAEIDRAEIRHIWEYLREGRNGHSNGGQE